jgi:photosystem II stability/assembly factor-like uncharacterized protein
VVGTYDGSTIRAYLNGLLVQETSHAGTISDPNRQLTFGFFSGAYWEGSLDEVSIYNRTITGEEVALLFGAYSGGAPAAGSWVPQTSPTTSSALQDLCFVDASCGWAVGQYSTTILHTTDAGQTWTVQTSPTSLALTSVSFVDSQNGWAAAGSYYMNQTAAGALIHTSDGGGEWVIQETSSQYALHSICFVDTVHGWAVGEDYAIAMGGDGQTAVYRTADGGQTWSHEDVHAIAGGLKHVFFVDAEYGWAVGQSGTIIHTTDGGVSWAAQTSGTNAWLYSVQFVDRQTGWAVGDPLSKLQTVFLKTVDGGSSWSVKAVRDGRMIRSIDFVDVNNGWGVGFPGSVVRTTDGGESWIWFRTDLEGWLLSVEFVDISNGWLVGYDGLICKYTVE